MPKMKTVKSISKRIKVSGGKKRKISVQSPGQDHFNARETGKAKRNKRRGFEISPVYQRTIRVALQ